MITQDITIRGLTPAQIAQLQEFVQRELMVNPSRPDDIARTAGELVHTPPLAPVPASSPLVPAAAPLSAPAVVSAPATLPAGAAAAPGAAPVAATPVDSRGIPHHPAYHGDLDSDTGGKKADGTWKRRRNHDKAAADAYEARYTSAHPTPAPAAAPASPPTQAPAATVDPTAVFGAPVGAPPAPPILPPVVPGSVIELEQLWTTLVTANRVGAAHADILTGWHGSGTVVGSAVYRDDPEKRQQAIDWLKQYLPTV